jgi:adenylate cyclase
MEPRVTVVGVEAEKKAWPVRRKAILAGAIAMLVLAIAVTIWNFYLRPAPPSKRAAFEEIPALELPDKPSIAVLPFVNMSGDPEQEYFSDGITEEIITSLTKIPQVFVIARNSTFTYKGTPVKVQQVSKDLGVRYVLEGSVRKAGDRIRITTQLADAITGHQLWAERYEGRIGDIFALQDKVTRKIVASLAIKLTSDQQEVVATRETGNVEAYGAFLQGREHYHRRTRNDMTKAVGHLKKAIELDSNYGRAHAMLAVVYSASTSWGWARDLGWSNASSLAEKHLQIAMKNPAGSAHRAAARIHIFKAQHEEAITEAERAIALEPNNTHNLHTMAYVLVYAGRSKEAIDLYKKAMRLNPRYPAQYLWFLGLAQFCEGQLEKAAASLKRARERSPRLAAWPLVAAYAHLGRKQEAVDAIADHMKRRGRSRPPKVKRILKNFPFKDPEDAHLFTEGLRKAGLK